MMVSFNGIGECVVTFEAFGDNLKGKVVKMCANGTVSECEDGDLFCGVAVTDRADIAGVQISGYVRVPFSGTAPSVGYRNLCADGNGGVALADGEGRSLLVVDVDEDAGTLGVIL